MNAVDAEADGTIDTKKLLLEVTVVSLCYE